MRIVAGSLRGRTIASPVASATRPTSDRVRESVFNILVHGILADRAAAVRLDGARVIDLFAGTGAMGLEAISRGAGYCLFVEDDAAARAAIRENVEAFGLTGQTRIFRRDATTIGPAGTMAPYGIAFLDPPYGRDLAPPTLNGLADGGWLVPGAIAVVEERRDIALEPPPGFAAIDTRAYGDTGVTFLRFGGTR